MSHANDKAGVKAMPVTGSCCGIRPSKEAMEVDFEVDFSRAKSFLEQSQSSEISGTPEPTQTSNPPNSLS